MYNNKPLTQYFSTTNHELHWIVAKTTRSSKNIETRPKNILQGINHIIQKVKILIAKINNDLT